MMRLLTLLLCCISLVQAEEFDAKVISVMDGDTVMVLRDGKKIKVRMANIDAPELAQAFGNESRRALSEKILKKQVHVSSRAVDAYGRLIAEISLNGHSVNEQQVREGMAWGNSHSHRDKRYLSLSQQAQQAGRGLWGHTLKPIAPEQWRKTHPPQVAHSNTQGSKALTMAQMNAGCGKKHLCSQMLSCEEAKVYLIQCGVKSLDGNGDGVPCESLCAEVKIKLN